MSKMMPELSNPQFTNHMVWQTSQVGFPGKYSYSPSQERKMGLSQPGLQQVMWETMPVTCERQECIHMWFEGYS